jgi:hypothetical protein
MPNFSTIFFFFTLVLTGVVTSKRRGKRSGDASFESGDRRLSQLFTPHAEAERLGFKTGRKTES